MPADRQTYHLLLFHGTNDIYSKIILGQGFIIVKNRDDHWLGNGVYFFREDEDQALTWAISRYRRDPKTNEAHVLYTAMNIEGQNFLNLDTRSGMRTLLRFLARLKRKYQGIKFKAPSAAALRHFVMEQLPNEYYVIQRTFAVNSTFDGIEEFRNMELRLQGTQVCVRNVKAITGEVSIVQTMRIQGSFA